MLEKEPDAFAQGPGLPTAKGTTHQGGNLKEEGEGREEGRRRRGEREGGKEKREGEEVGGREGGDE